MRQTPPHPCAGAGRRTAPAAPGCTRLILASASARRRVLLESAGWAIDVVPAPVAEWVAGHLTARELALANALRKAGAIARGHPERVVLGADTLVTFAGSVLGKPRDLAEARAMIRRLQGRTHEVYTAVCLAREHPRLRQTFVEQSRVTFRPLAEREIRAYLARIDPLDKAGAYAAQEPTDLRIIARIEGSRTNVYGLPMERLAPMLRALGFVPAG